MPAIVTCTKRRSAPTRTAHGDGSAHLHLDGLRHLEEVGEAAGARSGVVHEMVQGVADVVGSRLLVGSSSEFGEKAKFCRGCTTVSGWASGPVGLGSGTVRRNAGPPDVMVLRLDDVPGAGSEGSLLGSEGLS